MRQAFSDMTSKDTQKKKRILVLYYSQTGQLTSAARSMMRPLEDDAGLEFDITWENLQLEKPYPFPWPFLEFFNVFPESVHLIAPAMKSVSFAKDSRFDLIILAYQVWFLSPSLPITGFLKSEGAAVLRDTPVITLIVCRNMWLNAQEKVKVLLKAAGARHIDNAVLVDQGPPLATFVTTPRWLLTGRKNGFWGVFPPAGVSGSDIADASRFGRAIVVALKSNASSPYGSMLSGLGAVKVNPNYIASERVAHRSFYIWGKLLLALGPRESRIRKAALCVYVVFLLFMILTVVPLGIIMRVLLKPFIRRSLEKEVSRLEEPSGSSTERMAVYR